MEEALYGSNNPLVYSYSQDQVDKILQTMFTIISFLSYGSELR